VIFYIHSDGNLIEMYMYQVLYLSTLTSLVYPASVLCESLCNTKETEWPFCSAVLLCRA